MKRICCARTYQQFRDWVEYQGLNPRDCIPVITFRDVWKLNGRSFSIRDVVVIGEFWDGHEASIIWDAVRFRADVMDRHMTPPSETAPPSYYGTVVLDNGQMYRAVNPTWSPDVGQGMLIEDLLDESTLQWLERVKARKASNVKADEEGQEVSNSQGEGHTT